MEKSGWVPNMECRFDPDTEVLIVSFSAIMPGNVYLESSACVMKNGHLLFGTNHGLVVVDPEKSCHSMSFLRWFSLI